MDSIEIRPFTPADRDWVVAAHAALYAREAGFDESFGVLVGEIVDAFVAEHDSVCEQGWIAGAGDTPLGSIFCMRESESTARLRLFQLNADARGHGLGHRLLERCTGFARASGYTDIVLSTHRSHSAACALYLRNGWTEVAERAVHHYGQSLTELDMALTL